MIPAEAAGTTRIPGGCVPVATPAISGYFKKGDALLRLSENVTPGSAPARATENA